MLKLEDKPIQEQLRASATDKSRSGMATHCMTKETQVRTLAVLLALCTLAAVIFGWINLQKENAFPSPDDGVLWLERPGGLRAEHVHQEGPGQRAGIKDGDQLVAVNGQAVKNVAGLMRNLYRAGVWAKANYTLARHGFTVDVPVIIEPADRSKNIGLRLIALIYLGIGIYVLFRRWTAPKSTHFYVFCLVSFVLYAFHYTGKLNLFDWIILWSSIVATILQPVLFLHFALTFPEKKKFVRRHPWALYMVYLSGAALLGLYVEMIRLFAPSKLLLWNLDRAAAAYLVVLFGIAAGVLFDSYRKADNPILRQQMKWITRGTVLAITPYAIFFVIPFLRGIEPSAAMKVSVLSLVFLPLTLGYAIIRYRLMDVDLIFKRGMAYTLATAILTGLNLLVIGLVAEKVHTRLPNAGEWGLVVAVVVTALTFDPVRKWIQERLDRVFYHKRYDYRRTLIDFGRDLNSETNLRAMLSTVVDRLSHTLLVDRLAIFVATETPEGFVLAKSFGIVASGKLDLGFLAAEHRQSGAGHLFYENTRQVQRATPSEQATIAQLDLNYYIPCDVQNRTIAVLGLGKTSEGDFLSSEDVELLETLSSYIGIAIQNARLYASLQQKVSEYERLKDFNENIVESISVGVLAIDLADRVESWNSQMEVMYATPRGHAIGRPISDIFPAAFVEEFYRVRQNPGIHNLYKFRLGTRAGESRVANIAIAPLVNRNFEVVGRLIIVDDITERIELESQLSQAEKMSSIGLLAAGVAHEVNTPLAVISSYAQMLSKQLPKDERLTGLLEKITRQTFRASEIVNNLLNFSRTSGTEFGEVDVNKIISDTLSLLEHQLTTAKVGVDCELHHELPLILGNSGKLQQVFLNLFLNAKDAMPNGGTLRVSTWNGSGVNVSISDTGTGIAEEHISRIYDPFFTTKSTVRPGHHRGTGLGLSVTYGIIQEHAGKISVESKTGLGTTFHLEFPMIRKAVHV